MDWSLLLYCSLALLALRLIIGLLAGTLLPLSGRSLKTMIVLGSGAQAALASLAAGVCRHTWWPL